MAAFVAIQITNAYVGSVPKKLYSYIAHSSEKRGVCLMKSSSEMLQNLPYFIYTKTQSCFFHFSFHATLFFSLMNAPGLCRHRPGHSLGEKIKLHEMKNGKSNFGFSYV